MSDIFNLRSNSNAEVKGLKNHLPIIHKRFIILNTEFIKDFSNEIHHPTGCL